MNRRRILLCGGFPKEPSAYDEIIEVYRTADSFSAPKDGWYQIEVFGASGNGGSGKSAVLGNMEDRWQVQASGGSGGGGGYACSRVMLEKGDIVILSPGAVNALSSAVIQSSLQKYETLEVTSGGNGTDATYNFIEDTIYYGYLGSGGVASGGNCGKDQDGKPGYNGSYAHDSYSAVDFSGGAPGHPDGNAGGYGGGASPGDGRPGGVGKPGFIRISAGNTN